MIACVTWAAIAKDVDRPIFWPESIAIVAFAISWLAKGEAHKPIFRAPGSCSVGTPTRA